MPTASKMHFEISERKVLLYLFDALFVFTALYFLSLLFDYQYYVLEDGKYLKSFLLVAYIYIFGNIFEIYNLQTASNQFQILRNVVLTSITSVTVYLLTPVLSPELPKQRLIIIIFYFTVLSSLLLWRFFYVYFLASYRFVQNVVLICDQSEVEELVLGLENVDPHYKIIGFVNSDSLADQNLDFHYVKEIKKEDLELFVITHNISEIVIASQKTDGITADLYQQLLHLLENGNIIREYTQVYESKTQRIPVQYIGRDFYRFFPFSRSNNNRLYLLLIRLMELFFSLFGLMICLVLNQIILIANYF